MKRSRLNVLPKACLSVALSAPAGSEALELLFGETSNAGVDGLRFTCATRVGFGRCESLRREQNVAQCARTERR